MVVAAGALVAAALLPLPDRGAQGGTRVVRTIDGDTFVADRDGGEITVRLLNVDTPETVDPRRGVDCGGPEASHWLRDRLPPGSAVTLAHDVVPRDAYGRELAAVTAADGVLLNEEIAARGLGRAVDFGDNHALYGRVRAAEGRARAARVGLFAAVGGCPEPTRRPSRNDPGAGGGNRGDPVPGGGYRR